MGWIAAGIWLCAAGVLALLLYLQRRRTLARTAKALQAPARLRTTGALTVRLVTLTDPARRVYEFPLTDRVIVGRHATCDVQLSNDAEVSGRHCALLRAGDHVAIEDLKSTNGVWVNGVPIRGRHRLQSDDRIVLGSTTLRFTLP